MSLMDDVTRAVDGVRSTRGNMIGKCPAHDDRHRSFSYKFDNGKWLFRCFAGCNFEDILARLIDLGAIPKAMAAAENSDKIGLFFAHKDVGSFSAEFDRTDYALQAVYLYHDEQRNIIGFKARFKPKTFRHFTHGGKDRNYAQRSTAIPYRLPWVLDAVKDDTPIHCFEGEKDADNALALGMLECTSFGCATDPLPKEYVARFAGSRWVIWADNDAPGIKRADQVALMLFRNGCKVKLVIPPIGKDFSDWIASGATIEDVAALLAKTPEYLPAAELVEKLSADGTFPNTPYTIGSEAFAGEYFAVKCKDLKYVTDFGKWLYHNTKVWEVDKGGVHHEKVKALAPQLRIDTERIDEAKRKAIEKLASKIESDSGRKAVISTSKTVEAFKIDADKLDDATTKHLLSCDTGVIDLRTGSLSAHSPNYLITKHVPLAVDFDTKPERFVEFIEGLFHDQRVADWLFHFLGYCLTGETGFQHFVMLTAQTGSGKSQLLKILGGVLGDHFGEIDATSLVDAKQRSAAVESDLASMRGKRCVVAHELSASHRLAENTIKAITGGDTIKVKYMGQDKFPLRAPAKLIFTANERPTLSDDAAIARRLLELRFEIAPTKIVEELAEKMLAAEGPAILGFLAKRARATYEKPSVLSIPHTLRGWTDEYINEMNYMKGWFEVSAMSLQGAFTPRAELMASVEGYLAENRIPIDFKFAMLGQRLKKFGCLPDIQEGKHGWKNITLRHR